MSFIYKSSIYRKLKTHNKIEGSLMLGKHILKSYNFKITLIKRENKSLGFFCICILNVLLFLKTKFLFTQKFCQCIFDFVYSLTMEKR